VQRAEHSSREVLPSAASLSVISKGLQTNKKNPGPTKNVEPYKNVKKTAPTHASKSYGEWSYNSTHFTKALLGKGSQPQAPTALTTERAPPVTTEHVDERIN
jgi:hypothetical protein